MPISRERFNQGMTYEQYKASMTQNQEQFERNEQSLQLSAEDLAPFKSLAKPLDVAVVAEDWCGDVVANTPILARIAKESGKLNLRLFPRDANKDIMAEYMNGQYESIPVFAFFDENWNQVGVFIERPKSVSELRAQKTREIHEQHPEFGRLGAPASELPDDVRNRLQQSLREMRAETQAFYVRETVRELRELVEDVNRGASTGQRPWRGNLAGATA
jgi:predicted DNA-binding protein